MFRSRFRICARLQDATMPMNEKGQGLFQSEHLTCTRTACSGYRISSGLLLAEQPIEDVWSAFRVDGVYLHWLYTRTIPMQYRGDGDHIGPADLCLLYVLREKTERYHIQNAVLEELMQDLPHPDDPRLQAGCSYHI